MLLLLLLLSYLCFSLIALIHLLLVFVCFAVLENVYHSFHSSNGIRHRRESLAQPISATIAASAVVADKSLPSEIHSFINAQEIDDDIDCQVLQIILSWLFTF